jgi:hypothetical protein
MNKIKQELINHIIRVKIDAHFSGYLFLPGLEDCYECREEKFPNDMKKIGGH